MTESNGAILAQELTPPASFPGPEREKPPYPREAASRKMSI